MASSYTCNVIIDLEFTPVPRARRKECCLRNEIIEVGAVKVAPDGSIAGEFSHVVRPTLTRRVSCTVHHMTGIGDEDLAYARPLAEVLETLAAWIGRGRVRMVTWSESDLKQIREECAAKSITVALPARWLDIQRIYPRLMGIENHRRKVALGEAADWLGIPNDKESAHRALYDARMTAEVFRMMASGECAEHRERVASELKAANGRATCSSSIADRCGGLADLLARLRGQDERRAA